MFNFLFLIVQNQSNVTLLRVHLFFLKSFNFLLTSYVILKFPNVILVTYLINYLFIFLKLSFFPIHYIFFRNWFFRSTKYSFFSHFSFKFYECLSSIKNYFISLHLFSFSSNFYCNSQAI